VARASAETCTTSLGRRGLSASARVRAKSSRSFWPAIRAASATAT
jgi:hypothetical protein